MALLPAPASFFPDLVEVGSAIPLTPIYSHVIPNSPALRFRRRAACRGARAACTAEPTGNPHGWGWEWMNLSEITPAGSMPRAGSQFRLPFGRFSRETDTKVSTSILRSMRIMSWIAGGMPCGTKFMTFLVTFLPIRTSTQCSRRFSSGPARI